MFDWIGVKGGLDWEHREPFSSKSRPAVPLTRGVIQSGGVATLLQYMSGLSGVEGRDFHSYSYLVPLTPLSGLLRED